MVFMVQRFLAGDSFPFIPTDCPHNHLYSVSFGKNSHTTVVVIDEVETDNWELVEKPSPPEGSGGSRETPDFPIEILRTDLPF
jgi:hypothetical protein